MSELSDAVGASEGAATLRWPCRKDAHFEQMGNGLHRIPAWIGADCYQIHLRCTVSKKIVEPSKFQGLVGTGV